MPRLALAATAAAVVLAACASTPDTDFGDVPLASGLRLEVVPSDELLYRADNLPRVADRRGGGRLGSGFASGGYLGFDAIETLVEETEEELRDDLADAGVALRDDAPTVLRVVIEDARNNRPTFRQLSEEPSLDFQSFGVGGAELTATVISPAGAPLGTVEYRWYDTLEPNGFDQGKGVWTDATQAISRFSNRTAKALAGRA